MHRVFKLIKRFLELICDLGIKLPIYFNGDTNAIIRFVENKRQIQKLILHWSEMALKRRKPSFHTAKRINVFPSASF